MKMKLERTFGLSQPGSPVDESAEYIVQHKHGPDAALTERMLTELAELEKKHDTEINYSDAPELSDAEPAEFHQRHRQSERSGSDRLRN